MRAETVNSCPGEGEEAIPDRVTLLADVAEIVSRSHDLSETLNNVVDLVAKRLDADVCSLYLTSSNLQVLTLSATVGLRKDAVGRVQLRFGEGLVGMAASRHEPVVTDHASSHPDYKYFPETGEEEFEGLMAAPLFVSGTAIGVIAVQTREVRHFDPRDVGILQTCAQLIAPVVVNARLMALVDQPDDWSEGAAELAAAGIPVIGISRPELSERKVVHRGSPAARGIAIGRIYRLKDPLDLSALDLLLANAIASRFPKLPLVYAYACLLGTCLALYFIDISRFAFLPYATKMVVVGSITTLPMLFSGIVFIRSFANVESKGEALGANLMGALVGALLQSLTFVTGIKMLLLVVTSLYLIAMLTRPWPGLKAMPAARGVPVLTRG